MQVHTHAHCRLSILDRLLTGTQTAFRKRVTNKSDALMNQATDSDAVDLYIGPGPSSRVATGLPCISCSDVDHTKCCIWRQPLRNKEFTRHVTMQSCTSMQALRFLFRVICVWHNSFSF